MEKILSEMKEKLPQSTSLFQFLLMLEHYLKRIEETGCTELCLEDTIKSVNVIAKILIKFCSCRLDLINRVLKKDPRITTINKYLKVLIELLQQECGQQTSFSSASVAKEAPSITFTPQSQVVKTTKTIGKYETIRILGEGGMGIVWLAREPSGSSLVAIKEPKISGDYIKNELNIKQIMVEAEVLKNLNHPNIVKFIDYFVELGKPYLVMEYVEGEHLEKKTPEMQLNEKEAIDIIKKISSAVDHMHEHNIVHRDLKPKNIYSLSSNPYEIKILDFGTAKFFHSQLEYGEAIFSPGGYTPPEQLRFMYSPQGDIWSLGGILFYLLTKQHPIIAMPDYPHVKEPPKVERFVKEVDPRVIKTIKKAMDPDPVKRYLKASDFTKDILGEKDLVEKSTKPKLIVLGVEIPIEVNRVVIGRLSQDADQSIEKGHEKVKTFAERDNLYINIYDRNAYISRLHAELVYRDGSWYLRDLGSLNKTAILEEGRWKPIYASYRVPSKQVKLSKRSLISLGYDDKLGPYLVITFIGGAEDN